MKAIKNFCQIHDFGREFQVEWEKVGIQNGSDEDWAGE
jgi:hypothetical protein